MAQVDTPRFIVAPPLFFHLDNFTLLPYYRMTQKTKYYKHAQKYLSNHNALKKSLSEILDTEYKQPIFNGYYFPDNVPFQLLMIIGQTNADSHKCDLDNLIKSALDGAQGLIFKNDRFCDRIFTQRQRSETKNYLDICFSPCTMNPVFLFESLAAYNEYND